MSKFKVGDKVRAVDVYRTCGVTKGDVYEVLNVYGNSIQIIDNYRNDVYYSDYRFELVQEPFHFQVGDIVEFGGLEGEVTKIYRSDIYPLQVTLSSGREYFTLDGKWRKSHTKPLLNLVSRPKKKEKRIVKTKVKYSPSTGLVFSEDYQDPQPSDIIEVELEKEIEVEV